MIRYQIVDRTHKMCKSKPPEELHPRMVKFWKKHQLGACDGAILAFDKKNLIGFFRFYKKKRSSFLYAGGTYVLRPYRGGGIATGLWKRVLKKFKPECVDVSVASRYGARLINSLKKKYTKLTWFVNRI